MVDWSRYDNFTEDEFRCKCGCGKAEMSESFLDKLQQLRYSLGFPFPVNSGFRCSAHNAAVSKTGKDGPHTTGHAGDIGVGGIEAYRIIEYAPSYGFTGIGIQQKGQGRYIHLDDLWPLSSRPRPWIWSY